MTTRTFGVVGIVLRLVQYELAKFYVKVGITKSGRARKFKCCGGRGSIVLICHPFLKLLSGYRRLWWS